MATRKVVLITGGGSGIGRATALQFAADGALVVICGRNLDRLEQTVYKAHNSEGRIEPFQLDLTDNVAVNGLVEHIMRRFGRIDVLVNNAGQALSKPVLETSTEEWRGIFEVNLLGTVNCCKAVLPAMLADREGVIINISSILGKKAIGSMAAYCASKFAVIALTQSLAEETRGSGVRVHAVCPGATDTPLHRDIVGDELAAQAMPPEQVAQLICLVASGSLVLSSGADIVIDSEIPQELPAFLKVVRSFSSIVCMLGSKLKGKR
jgi:NAD(P)-dependent dehydrogenase (short-subunit alcohol dehydrogenase family)